MGEVVVVDFREEDIVRISSREVAVMMDVTHSNLVRKIDGIKRMILNKKGSDSAFWIESTYKTKGNNKSYKEYLVSKKGCKLIFDNSQKTKNLEKLVKYIGVTEEINLMSRFEYSFKECLINTLDGMNIEVECQKAMFDGKYRIDFYIPQYNLAIEYDEEQHKYKIEEDHIRQIEIEKELGCKTIRLDYQNNDNYNVGLVIREIMKG